MCTSSSRHKYLGFFCQKLQGGSFKRIPLFMDKGIEK